MSRLRAAVAWPLYWLCYAFDCIPYRDGIDKRWYRQSGFGCRIGIAKLAWRIEGD